MTVSGDKLTAEGSGDFFRYPRKHFAKVAKRWEQM